MTKTAIRVENLGKQYELGTKGRRGRYRTLRESLMDGLRAPARRLKGSISKPSGSEPVSDNTFWALDDVSFTVKAGEIVGIIGRNGAGKSTLLKILSRITEPTRGQVVLHGRVASLLEVGTGFHPELTGRENIFLNGAILGMRRAEIKTKFDEIVAFAEVEKFLDTPVKRYSSGMYVRLAFAVAAHLQPEILIVDEVLAVGDATFQKKCLNKMQDVGQGGRTVLFVSHNMQAVVRLCSRAILLSAGKIIEDAPATQVTRTYLTSGVGTVAIRQWSDARTAPGDDVARLRAVRVIDQEGQAADVLDIRAPVGIEITYEVLDSSKDLVANFVVNNEDGYCICHPHDWENIQGDRKRHTGIQTRTAWIPGNLLAEGTFTVGVAVSSYNPPLAHCGEQDAVAFQVTDPMEGSSSRHNYTGPFPGLVRPLLRWTDAPAFHGPARELP
jgi:lipopolysaccharide transport system ATP-binding protein